MSGSPKIAVATYRLQFSHRFQFKDALEILPYLKKLGIDTLYGSPYFAAKPLSDHGYDVINPNRINPEIGSPQEHAELFSTAAGLGIAHLIDVVPNHMGVGGGENSWWQDVLTWGEASKYANYFDIDWQPTKQELKEKVLLPVLGDHYSVVLERGELELQFLPQTGEFVCAYGMIEVPLRAGSYALILSRIAAEVHSVDLLRYENLSRLAEDFSALDLLRLQRDGEELLEALQRLKSKIIEESLSADVQTAIARVLAHYRVLPDSDNAVEAADRLDGLLASQHYRLAYWHVARYEINYRRFFDVNDLAGLKIENNDVLLQTHRLILELIEKGLVQGLRIDHIDGLKEPGSYCRFMRSAAQSLGKPVAIYVEKILATHEELRSDWRVTGTTGYEFGAMVNRLFVDRNVEGAFDAIYQKFTGLEKTFARTVREAKQLIMETQLSSELTVLSGTLERIAATDRRSKDLTLVVLREALMLVIAEFSVYRTYLDGVDASASDIKYITEAVSAASDHAETADDVLFTFIKDALTTQLTKLGRNYNPQDVIDFAMKFQQYTSPVMAKSVEDTADYRYCRLLSLNEVGADPERFGSSIAEFHHFSQHRANNAPRCLSATATHDHKRGEDVRTRISGLSEIPLLWQQGLSKFKKFSQRSKLRVGDTDAPSSNVEYAIYQTLVGTWPMEWLDSVPEDPSARETYTQRLHEYFRKFLREEKTYSSWLHPKEEYENATNEFISRLLDPSRSALFQKSLLAIVAITSRLGAISSFSQTVLKCLAPGIPDFFQGCELWDLSLVDPDNRRSVDFAQRDDILRACIQAEQAGQESEWLEQLMSQWQDGRVKAWLICRLLRIRANHHDTLLSPLYTPLRVTGKGANSLIAFERGNLVTVVPRLCRGALLGVQGLRVSFPDGVIHLSRPAGKLRNLLTGDEIESQGRRLTTQNLFPILPVSVFEYIT